jgi:hypothetical protein
LGNATETQQKMDENRIKNYDSACQKEITTGFRKKRCYKILPNQYLTSLLQHESLKFPGRKHFYQIQKDLWLAFSA